MADSLSSTESKTPTLYKFYEDDYNFTDLQKKVDIGLPLYIDRLKKGNKYNDEIKDAVYNIMSGIEDGTITVKNGRFHDSLGRYSNNSNKNRDIYGWAANYIYKTMQSIDKYLKPESKNDKKEWNSNSLTSELLSGFFNSSSPDISYFMELDPYVADNGSRGTVVRGNALADWITNNINDNLYNKYTGYTDLEKDALIKEAITLALDLRNGVTPNEYFRLSRLFPGLQWDKFFHTGDKLTDTTLTSQQTSELQTLTALGFLELLNLRSPRALGDSLDINLNFENKLTDYVSSRYLELLDNLTTKDLYILLQKSINEPTFDFGSIDLFLLAIEGRHRAVYGPLISKYILSSLRKRGQLLSDPANANIEYILGLLDENSTTGYYYNSSTNTLHKRNKQDIPYYLDLFWKEYSGQDIINPNIMKYFVLSNQLGGILKAEGGTKFNNIYFTGIESPDYNKDLNKIFLNEQVIDWVKLNYNGNSGLTDYLNFIKNNVDSRYKYGINDFLNQKTQSQNEGVREFNIGYLNNGNTLNYTLFGDNNSNGVFNEMFNVSRPKNGGEDGDRFNENSSKDYTGSILGAMTYSRVGSLTDANLDSGLFGEWGRLMRNMGATGAYYYTADGDSSNKGQWIPTSDTSIKGYKSFDMQPLKSSTRLSTPKFSIKTPDIEISSGTNINLREAKLKRRKERGQKIFTGEGLYSILSNIPDIVGLSNTLRTNNRIARLLTDATKPFIRNTYELYSPVVGDYGTLLSARQSAALIESLSARPLTSDASLWLASRNLGTKNANELRLKGQLIYDLSVKQSAKEALARVEDNKARRSLIANANAKEIHDTNYRKAEIEATRLLSNTASINNFLEKLGNTFISTYLNNKNRRKQLSQLYASTAYQNALKTYNDNYMKEHPDATTDDMMKDPEYKQKVLKLNNRYKYDLMLIAEGRRFSNPYRGQKVPTYEDILFSKRGGTLKPSLMYIINKIIKDENNT